MSEKKILLLISFLEPWSMGQNSGAPSLYQTIRGFAENGWQVHYLTAQKNSLSGGSHEQEISIDIAGVSVHRFKFPMRFNVFGARIQSKLNRLYFFPKYAAESSYQLMRDINPTLIYAYEEGAVLALNRLKRSHVLSCPVLHRFQGTILGAAYKNMLTITRKIESWLALRALADLYVMTDDGTLGDKALAHWNFNVSSDNLLFIRNGLDLSLNDDAEDRGHALGMCADNTDSPILLMVSRLAGWKRVDRGIDLVAELKADYPNTKLIIAGDGEFRTQLKDLANQKGVGENVFFAGSLPRSQVFSLMQSCDIFLSLYDVSNCGNPLFEALLNGIPIITLDNGSTSEVIKDRVNGLLLQPDDRKGLLSATRELYENKELRQKFSRRGAAWVKRNMLSWDERMQKELRWVESRIKALSE